MILKIYLIRHGETDFNKQGKEWGQDNNIPLNDLGVLQSIKLLERLEGIKFNKVFSSDLKRAKQTAEEINKSLKVEIIFDERLREYDPGEVDPQSEKWVEKYKELLESGMSKYDIRPFGGENIWDLIKRTGSFLEDLENEEGIIAIISHSGVNIALMNLSQGRSKDEFLAFKQDNVCINVLEYDGKKWVIKVVNDSEHINELIPKKKLYEKQEEVKQMIEKYVFEKLSPVATSAYLTGDILEDTFGIYNRPHKRYKGSSIEIFAILKKEFEIPKKWKISELNGNRIKYEIGKIKIENISHKINLTIIENVDDIIEKKEKLI